MKLSQRQCLFITVVLVALVGTTITFLRLNQSCVAQNVVRNEETRYKADPKSYQDLNSGLRLRNEDAARAEDKNNIGAPTSILYKYPQVDFPNTLPYPNREDEMKAYDDLHPGAGDGEKEEHGVNGIVEMESDREPVVIKKAKLSWEEKNGVVFRPIPKMSREEKLRAPRVTDYEPFLPFNQSLFFPNFQHKHNVTLAQRKIILWYTPTGYTPGMKSLTALRFCPEFPCWITTNRDYKPQSAMLAFNGNRIQGRPPRRTSPKQIFLFHMVEPHFDKLPYFTKINFSDWRHVFDWTMSYRTDSSIPAYYGVVRKHPNPPRKNYTQILSKKKNLAAWMVSHCNTESKREKYVAELKKYIDVDIYGGCGSFKCARSKDEECSQNIQETYKFFLGFENGICHDYITEKFFKLMPRNIVTVARASNEFHEHAPAGTFINTADFASPRRLAEYLRYLDNNDEEYIKILKEKDKYIYLYEEFCHRRKNGDCWYVHYHYESIPFCQACQQLWNLESNSDAGRIDLLKWIKKAPCKKPDDFE